MQYIASQLAIHFKQFCMAVLYVTPIHAVFYVPIQVHALVQHNMPWLAKHTDDLDT